jgi:hypothetical protein
MSAYDLLREHVESMKGTVRLQMFDGGQTVYVRIPGETRERRYTHLWGDPKTACEQALDDIRKSDIVLPPVVIRARSAMLPAKDLDPWGPERMTYEDELNAWRERTTN